MSLRVQTAAQNHESRPSPRDTKIADESNRWDSIGITHYCRHNHNSGSCNCNQQHNRDRTDSNNSEHSIMTSSSCSSAMIPDTSFSTRQCHGSSAIGTHESSINYSRRYASSPSVATRSVDTPNVMKWMQNDCPKDVVPLILAFAGPQKIATIRKTNRFWRQVMNQEETWSRLCESLYKWKEGDDTPHSWKSFYIYNPCVPIDYSTIRTAIKKVTAYANKDSSTPSGIRILLRPGRYSLRKAIAMGDKSDKKYVDIDHSIPLTIETMIDTPGSYHSCDSTQHSNHELPSDRSRGKLKTAIRNIFRCRTVDVENEDDEIFENGSLDEILDDSLQSSVENKSTSSVDGQMNFATLVLKTRRHNEPLFRIEQGSFTLRNVNLIHGSSGMDIWNGNAAIQIQPKHEPDEESFDMTTHKVTLDSVDITSWSGRGVVNVDGGELNISNSYIHDCAATGIYIGGTGSRATVERTDVIKNGRGNRRTDRGISSGHSGIYMEQGDASIVDCNVSRNTLTGISAISSSHAILNLEDSDLYSNGTYQLEMPPLGSVALRNSTTTNNTLSSSGIGRPRSILFETEES